MKLFFQKSKIIQHIQGVPNLRENHKTWSPTYRGLAYVCACGFFVSWVFRTFPLTIFLVTWSPKIRVMWELSVFIIFKTQQHSVGSSRQVWPFLLTGFRDKVQQQGLCGKSTAQQKNLSNNKTNAKSLHSKRLLVQLIFSKKIRKYFWQSQNRYYRRWLSFMFTAVIG